MPFDFFRSRRQRAANFRRLRDCVRALAAEPDDQLRVHPSWVRQVDELAADHSHWFGVAKRLHPKHLSATQEAALTLLDETLSEMSGEANAELWEVEALRTHPAWEHVRALARSALESFGWTAEPPPPSPDAFVPGGS